MTRARVDAMLASLSDERLRAFVRLQAEEFPALIDNLRIFTQATDESQAVESDEATGGYAGDIAAALAEVNVSSPYAEWYESAYDDDAGAVVYDEVEELLEPFWHAATEYLEQDNRIESGKIYEAILHACSRARHHTPDDDGDAVLDQAGRALDKWAELIGQAPDELDKPRLFERFVVVFASDAATLGVDAWQRAFRVAVQDGLAAEMALCCIDAIELDDGDTDKAGVLTQLLDLSGDTDRFLRVGRAAVRHRPALAPRLVRKLFELGQRDEAVEVAETALHRLSEFRSLGGFLDTAAFASVDSRDAREALLRFLVEACDPLREPERLLAHARRLFFDYGDPKDYARLRDLLSAESEIDGLLRQVTDECSPETVAEVLSAEQRWDDLLAYARGHRDNERAFPRVIRRLGDHRPEACFDLCRQAANRLLERGTGERLYRGVAAHARLMRDIPGQEDRFGEYMAWMTETYRRRPSLIRMLGDLAVIGQDWRERRRRSGNLVPADASEMGVDELASRCPIHLEATALIAKGGQRSAAALVWAVLVRNGGTLDAAAITEAIATHRGLGAPSAAAVRSNGLRLLEDLACVSIEREGHRLRRVRLLDVGDADGA
jgi:hypothetical protein